MAKKTKWAFWVLIITGMMAWGSCSVLKSNGCGCPPIPTTGKMKH